jgi:hypothetical protein
MSLLAIKYAREGKSFGIHCGHPFRLECVKPVCLQSLSILTQKGNLIIWIPLNKLSLPEQIIPLTLAQPCHMLTSVSMLLLYGTTKGRS